MNNKYKWTVIISDMESKDFINVMGFMKMALGRGYKKYLSFDIPDEETPELKIINVISDTETYRYIHKTLSMTYPGRCLYMQGIREHERMRAL